jgi:hypothetical protein
VTEPRADAVADERMGSIWAGFEEGAVRLLRLVARRSA